jgi:hypothetical protein
MSTTDLRTLAYELVDYVRILRGTITAQEIYNSEILSRGIPVGFAFFDFRPPIMGEWYLAIGSGDAAICSVAELSMPRIILRRIR